MSKTSIVIGILSLILVGTLLQVNNLALSPSESRGLGQQAYPQPDEPEPTTVPIVVQAITVGSPPAPEAAMLDTVHNLIRNERSTDLAMMIPESLEDGIEMAAGSFHTVVWRERAAALFDQLFANHIAPEIDGYFVDLFDSPNAACLYLVTTGWDTPQLVPDDGAPLDWESLGASTSSDHVTFPELVDIKEHENTFVWDVCQDLDSPTQLHIDGWWIGSRDRVVGWVYGILTGEVSSVDPEGTLGWEVKFHDLHP